MIEDLVKKGRFVTITYGSFYTVEVSIMHPQKHYTMNIRGNGDTIQEAVQIVENKLEAILEPYQSSS